MTVEIILRYVHFISIFAIVSAVVAEHLLLKESLTGRELKRLARIDGVYGLGAIILVAAGLLLWFSYGKPAEFYTKNHIFLTKVALAVIMGILSIHPTVFFLRSRKRVGPEESIQVPSSIKWVIRIELLIIFLIPLLAAMMAKGVGYVN